MMGGNMRAWLGGVTVLATALCLVLPAAAQDAQMRAQVQVSESDLDALVARMPALGTVSDAIAADCARRLPDDARTPGFCRCAAAVAFTMWMSGVDGGQLRGLVNSYAGNPSAAGLTDLMHFQGPDTYRSACRKALGTN